MMWVSQHRNPSIPQHAACQYHFPSPASLFELLGWQPMQVYLQLGQPVWDCFHCWICYILHLIPALGCAAFDWMRCSKVSIVSPSTCASPLPSHHVATSVTWSDNVVNTDEKQLHPRLKILSNQPASQACRIPMDQSQMLQMDQLSCADILVRNGNLSVWLLTLMAKTHLVAYPSETFDQHSTTHPPLPYWSQEEQVQVLSRQLLCVVNWSHKWSWPQPHDCIGEW